MWTQWRRIVGSEEEWTTKPKQASLTTYTISLVVTEALIQKRMQKEEGKRESDQARGLDRSNVRLAFGHGGLLNRS